MAEKTATAYLYVLDTLADWEIGHITAEMSSGRFDNRASKPKLVRIGNGLQPIKTMGGIAITPEMDMNSVAFKEGDVLILPGGDTWMDGRNGKILDIAAGLLKKNVAVAAICGATIALANKGVLDNRRHTSNDLGYLKAMCPEYRGGEHYVNEPAVVDGNLITASGFGALEFSHEVFGKIGFMKPDTLAAWYGLYKTRDAKYFFQLMESLK